MKFGKLLNNIINDNFYFIDYNHLKKQIFNKDFITILNNNINFFDQNYKLITYFNKEIYEYIIINYLSIQKLIKKYNKKNKLSFVLDLEKYKFYNDIINPKYIDNKKCNICYDNGFIIKTDYDASFVLNVY